MPEDTINPQHYKTASGTQVIDVTEELNFCRGNVVKYVSRAGKKGGPETEIEDLKKAMWYLKREFKRMGISDDV